MMIDGPGCSKSIQVFLLGVALWCVVGCRNERSTGEGSSPDTPEAQAYRGNLQLSKVGLAKGENYLGNEVYYVEGTISNIGAKSVKRVDLTFLFRDSLNQVVLRETRRALEYKGSRGLEPKKSATFQVGFDHLPKDWNFRIPEVRVSSLSFK